MATFLITCGLIAFIASSVFMLPTLAPEATDDMFFRRLDVGESTGLSARKGRRPMLSRAWSKGSASLDCNRGWLSELEFPANALMKAAKSDDDFATRAVGAPALQPLPRFV